MTVSLVDLDSKE